MDDYKSLEALRNAETAFENVMKTYSEQDREAPKDIVSAYREFQKRRVELERLPAEGAT